MPVASQQTGAYVLKTCTCGNDFPVRRSSAARCELCPDCRKSVYRQRWKERYAAGTYVTCRDVKARSTLRKERKEKERRRREFFAARDAAFERAGLPVPKIETRQDKIVESRGRIPGGTRVAFVKF